MLGRMPETTAAAPVAHRLFIAGAWIEGVTGETFQSLNPADRRDVVGTFQAGTAADTAMAIKAAEVAFPAWRSIDRKSVV